MPKSQFCVSSGLFFPEQDFSQGFLFYFHSPAFHFYQLTSVSLLHGKKKTGCKNGWSLNKKKPCSKHCVFFFANYSMWICLRALSLCGVWPLQIENPQVLQRGRDDGRRRWQEIHRHKYPFGCRLYGWQTSHTRGGKKIQFKLKGGDTERPTHSVKPSYIKRRLCGP